MATNEQIYDFISKYYDVNKGIDVCERKSFVRFRDAMPLGLDSEQIEQAYTAFSGKSPRYNKAASSMEPWRIEDYKSKANRIIDDALMHYPTSFTDLATKADIPIYDPADSSLRKCFKAMAAAGVIGCVEVKTCGKCHIRLYYLND